MDALDLQIVRTMGVVPFGAWPHSPESLKPSYISAKVGATTDRVQDRIRAMEEAGIITGYDVYPNPRAFDVKETTFHIQVAREDKKRVVAAMWETDGVFGVYEYVGDHACVQLLYRDEADLAAKLEAIAKEAGLDGLPMPFFDRPYPRPERSPTPLELRILKTMRGRARASPSEIAGDLDVSVRTVRRRLDAMSTAGLYDVYVWLDLGAIQGRLPVELTVSFPVKLHNTLRPQVLELVKDDLLFWWQPVSAQLGAMELELLPTSTARTEELRKAVADLPGVERVEILLASDSRYSGSWIDGLIEERLKGTPLTVDG